MESPVISEVLARITINSHRMIHRAYGLLRTWSHVAKKFDRITPVLRELH